MIIFFLESNNSIFCRYLESDQGSDDESELPFSEEEKVLEECDEYEQKYNFRFEEPDKNFVSRSFNNCVLTS